MNDDDCDDDLWYLEGLFVGSLSERDMKVFERAVADGLAKRVYEGASGFMGLAKVRILNRP